MKRFPLSDPREAPAGTWIELLARLATHFNLLAQINRERRDLQKLDDRQLRDVGITREDANREASRPYWDVPVERMRTNEPRVEETPAPYPLVTMQPVS
ncbi:MAG: DUF1127 domain-containing protein [Hyphomicrobiaceae bacterium]